MEEIVKELDQNNDGTIEFSEFLKVMAVPKRGSAAFKLMTRVSYGSKSANCMRRQSNERRESEQKPILGHLF
jgi:Ca2+-binding EF-hand superfamily protein